MLNNNKNNNNDIFIEEDQLPMDNNTGNDSATKPHVIRRNIEDYLEKRKLERRLQDIFDDDFLLD